jgi:putative aminopeptidase FrvX
MPVPDLALLEKLCRVHAPSGEEAAMTRFILRYVRRHAPGWKVKPVIHAGAGFQDSVVLAFGKPDKALIAHMDSIGFTVRYHNGLVPIGSPALAPGTRLSGQDGQGTVSCVLQTDSEGAPFALSDRTIDPGTSLVFDRKLRQSRTHVQAPYLDNRLGLWVALRTCETIENGLVLFSCYEEHGGGNAGFLARFAYERYGVSRFIVCDITWATESVRPGGGVAVSLRDRYIPRASFVESIRSTLDRHRVKYQAEVEGSGGSDGSEIQRMPWPLDWCFVGAPEENVHSPDERVHLDDIRSMLRAYRVLMKHL